MYIKSWRIVEGILISMFSSQFAAQIDCLQNVGKSISFLGCLWILGKLNQNSLSFARWTHNINLQHSNYQHQSEYFTFLNLHLTRLDSQKHSFEETFKVKKSLNMKLQVDILKLRTIIIFKKNIFIKVTNRKIIWYFFLYLQHWYSICCYKTLNMKPFWVGDHQNCTGCHFQSR